MLPKLPADSTLHLKTARLVLEPIVSSDAHTLWQLLRDPELHRFTPNQPLTLEKYQERCIQWATRRSPNQDELWLNWLARKGDEVIGHFQVGVKEEDVACDSPD